jgi:hypothetical protein
MAYYIFLKSLRSLEEFRKNPHIKIPPKSPPTNLQSLGIFKNQIFIRKRIFPSLSSQSAQWPVGPSGLSAQPRPLFFPTSRSPSPHWASASQPAQPTARRWRPARLPPPSRENTSPRAAFAPLRALLTGGPDLSSPSSGAARAPLDAAALSSCHGCRAPSLYGRQLPLLNLGYNHNYSLYPPLFNLHCHPLPSSPPRRTSSGPINWPPRPRRSLHLPHLTLPPLPKHECRCC